MALLRSFSQQIQKRTGTTDEQRGGLGITIPDTEPTPVPAPTTAPSLNIVTAERLRHVVEAAKTAEEGAGLGWVAWASRPRIPACAASSSGAG